MHTVHQTRKVCLPSLCYTEIAVSPSFMKQILHNLFYWCFKLNQSKISGVHHAVRLKITEAFKCTTLLMKLNIFHWKMYSSCDRIQPPLMWILNAIT